MITPLSEVVFTDEDKSNLVKAKCMIIDYLRGTVVPQMTPGSCITVDFGEHETSGFTGNQTTEYHFGVYAEPQQFENGTGNIGFGFKFGGIRYSLLMIERYDVLYAIVLNWDTIKWSISNKLLEQSRKTEMLRNFNI